MKKCVRLWLIVLAIGAIVSAFIVSRLDRMITVSEVQITKDYTIEETLYKDAITCTEDGTLLGSFKNSYTEENYIYLSGLEKNIHNEKSVYIPIELKHLGNESYAQRGSWYYLLLATVYKGNIIKNLIMDCQSYTKYRPNETTGGIFVSWRRKEELPTGA